MVKNIKPIPLELLGDSATYVATKSGRWGVNTVSETELTDILIQPADKLNQTAQNESNSYKLLFFFDMVNSKPQNTTFKVDDRIRYDDKEYRIVSIEKIKVFRGGIHHLEVVLE